MQETIVQTAQDLFQRHGFDTVTLDEIAATVGIKRPHLQLYFATTEAIRQSAAFAGAAPTSHLVA